MPTEGGGDTDRRSEPQPTTGSAGSPAAAPVKPGRFGGLGTDYWKLWSGSVISNLGDGISSIAYPWLASTLTRNPALIAGVAVATRLPWLLVTLPAGALIDRSDRRTIMVAANLARGAIAAAVGLAVLTGNMTIPLLYVTALALGTAEVLYDNAGQTILPRLVPKERLERANGNLWGAEMVLNQFVGPPVGGILIGVALAVPFLIDGLTAVVSAGLIFLIAGAFRAQEADGVDVVAETRRSMGAEIVEGVKWLWANPLLRTLAIFLGVMNGITTASFATFVLFVQEILGLDSTGFGILMTASAIGGVLGSQVAPAITKRIGPGPSLYVALGAGVVTGAVTGSTSVAVVVGAMSALFMFTAVMWNIITVSLRQTIIPDHLLGRVNSVYRFFGWGMMPIGAALGGAVVTWLEPALGRELALRSPWFLSAAVHLVLLAFAFGRLTTANIEATKTAAAR
ncbi:MAG: MFS transporter [Egibacteraceae bacterium]